MIDRLVLYDVHNRMRNYAAVRLWLARWGCRKNSGITQYIGQMFDSQYYILSVCWALQHPHKIGG